MCIHLTQNLLHVSMWDVWRIQSGHSIMKHHEKHPDILSPQFLYSVCLTGNDAKWCLCHESHSTKLQQNFNVFNLFFFYCYFAAFSEVFLKVLHHHPHFFSFFSSVSSSSVSCVGQHVLQLHLQQIYFDIFGTLYTQGHRHNTWTHRTLYELVCLSIPCPLRLTLGFGYFD